MICTSIANVDVNECLELISKEAFAEIRIDMMDLSVSEVKKIFSSHNNLIATCRPGKISDDKRKELLSEAITSGAAYVDVEVDSSDSFKKTISEFAGQNNVKLIISYHNFEKTPLRVELEHLLTWCNEYNPEIIKIAAKVNSTRDNARLLSLLDTDKKMIIIGMGEMGKLTRVISTKLGSFCTYAAVNKSNSTAEGQFSKDELINYMERLGFE
jgi:3-dehydroquinate dehydratase-1